MTEPGPLFSLSLDQLKQRTSMKWRIFDADVLPAWVAEMDVRLCDAVVDAVTDAVRAGDVGYPDSARFRAEMHAYVRRTWPDFDVAVERLRTVPDVMGGVQAVLEVLTEPGAKVAVSPPVYPPFYSVISDTHRQVVNAPLTAAGRLDFDSLERAFEQAEVYILCNPHNPTGVVHTREELQRVAELAAAHDVWVISDEIHAPIVYPGHTFVPYLSLPGTDRAASVMSLSKAWNLPGMKAGFAILGADVVDPFAHWSTQVATGATHIGTIANMAAAAHGGPWLEQVLGELDANRYLVRDLLAEHLPQIRYSVPEGTYLAWLDCRDLGWGEDPGAVFKEKGRVALNHGHTFGPGGEGHVRLNFATSPAVLHEVVARMKAALP